MRIWISKLKRSGKSKRLDNKATTTECLKYALEQEAYITFIPSDMPDLQIAADIAKKFGYSLVQSVKQAKLGTIGGWGLDFDAKSEVENV